MLFRRKVLGSDFTIQKSKTKKPITVQPRKRFKKNTETLLRTSLINAMINGIKFTAIIKKKMINCQKPILINLKNWFRVFFPIFLISYCINHIHWMKAYLVLSWNTLDWTLRFGKIILIFWSKRDACWHQNRKKHRYQLRRAIIWKKCFPKGKAMILKVQGIEVGSKIRWRIDKQIEVKMGSHLCIDF